MKTKSRLLISLAALLLTCSMLVGTTYAWFSESVTSENNVITAGNLDVDLYWSEDLVTWHNAENGPAVFSSGSWEPGYSQTRYLKIINSGELALRYSLTLNADGELSKLAGVIDVFTAEGPSDVQDYSALSESELSHRGTLAGVQGRLLRDNVLLPDGEQSDTYRQGSEIMVVSLKMKSQVSNEYQGLSLGSFRFKVDAVQFAYEEDSFGNGYEDGMVTDVTIEKPLVEGVCTILPENAISSASGVVFSGSPYAYINKALFSGKRISKIGIPVKTVSAIDENQTFTLSVVKTTSDTYEYVEKYTLKLPLDQLGESTTVNKWVYVDLSELNILLAEDETLAFGMPTDTVSWGYISKNNTRYNFRSATGKWSAYESSASIYFDVYTEQILHFEQTENGLQATYEAPVFDGVLSDFPASSISSGNDVSFASPPYAYTVNKDIFAGKTLTKIGIPVKKVNALNENQTFTLSVVKTTSEAYEYVAQYTLTLPVEQLGASTTVNSWVYVDLSHLDITLAEDETLAFGGKNDTVTWAWKNGYSSSQYYFRNVDEDWNKSSGGIFFDVYVKEILTYEEYLDRLAKEQERLEAELERKQREQELKALLSGKSVSILGDSISTYAGYSNNTSYNGTIGNNAVYYTGSNYVTNVNETWWMQAISRTGTQLLVNNSYSGDRVTVKGLSRALQLHNNQNISPDIIAVYLGINDFRTGVTKETFASKYDEMIGKMVEKYTDADIFLFTLVYTTDVNSGVDPDDLVYFNEAIEATAEKYGLPVVDLYNDSGINKQTMSANMGDGDLHPNYAGMDKITECFISTLMEEYLQGSGT